MFENQKREFDPKSTSVARLRKRRDELRASGDRSGVVGKLSRLISKMERPVVVPKGRKSPESWSPNPQELAGGAKKPRPSKEEKPKGPMRASQRAQLRRS